MDEALNDSFIELFEITKKKKKPTIACDYMEGIHEAGSGLGFLFPFLISK